MTRSAFFFVLSLIAFICEPVWAYPDEKIENISPSQQKSFPTANLLEPIGEGMLDAIIYPNIKPSSVLIRVYITKARKQQAIGSWVYSQTADTRVYLHDVKSNCLSMFDQQKQVAKDRSNSYVVTHDATNDCQQQSNLSQVNMVTIRKCRPQHCKIPLSRLILLKGEAEFEGVTFSGELYFAGELPMPAMYP